MAENLRACDYCDATDKPAFRVVSEIWEGPAWLCRECEKRVLDEWRQRDLRDALYGDRKKATLAKATGRGKAGRKIRLGAGGLGLHGLMTRRPI